MSDFKQIEKKVKQYLKSNPINNQGLCNLFNEDPEMTIDAYIQQNKYYCTQFLLHISQYSPDLLKERMTDFLSDSKHIRPFLENQDLYAFTEWAIAESEIVRFIKYSGLILYDNWQGKWSRFLKNSQKQEIKDFCKEATFLNQFYLKIKKQAEKSTWLQTVDWQTFLSLFTYHLYQENQGNLLISPKNLVDAEPLFFVLQHKKEGLSTIDQAKFEKLTDELIKKEFVESGLLAIPKKDALQKLGYEEFQKTLTNYTYLLSAKKMLEHYCYSDNVAVEFLTDEIGRVYAKSVVKEADFQKNTLKYSYCSRFYNTGKGTILENHFSAQSIKDYFMDFGFEINVPLKLKKKDEKDKNEKERFIRIDLIAEICENLRNLNSSFVPYMLLEKEVFLKDSFEERWKDKYSKDEFENIFDFLAEILPFTSGITKEDERKKVFDKAELFKIPIFQIDKFFLWFPQLMIQTDFLTGLLNKIWENLADNDKKYGVDEQKKVADKQAEILKELLENRHNIKNVVANHKFTNNSPEFDLAFHNDEVTFLMELKTTNFRNSDKGIFLHQKEAIDKACTQLEKRLEWMVKNEQNANLFKNKLGINGKTDTYFIAVTNSFDFDNQVYRTEKGVKVLVVSYFTLIVLLRNERHRLFDKNLILEKVSRLMLIEPYLQQFNFGKIDRFADEWLMYESNETLTGKDLWNLILLDATWSYWMDDNWDLLSGEYISPNKELGIICNDENRKDVIEVVKKYNRWQEFFVADMQNGGKGVFIMPNEHKKDAIKFFDEFLKLFPTHTETLFCRGKFYFGLQNYEQAIADFEKIFELDFAEGAGLNSFENKALDWLIQAYRFTKQLEQARKLAKKCLQYPECYLAILTLAELELEFGDKTEAQRLAKIYAERIPMSDYARRIQEATLVRMKFGL
ncbi:MAG: hypothetical protein MUE85_08140 [Microscillaceae bacterium]|nr:hypothetical protein [Microscillaceae bacterium]